MLVKAPFKDNKDILGALSLVVYTLILIPLVKYVFVVLWANDNGGTFALYSLICQHAKVSLLPMLVLAGTSMVIADGVVTPAMSVMSAVASLKVGVDAINQDQMVMITVAFLIILFSTQKFGTSKAGIAVGPALSV